MVIRFRKPNILLALMVFFSMTPFILPFPGLGSDMQPYALLLGLCMLMLYSNQALGAMGRHWQFQVLLVPLVVAVLCLVVDMFSLGGFRGAYNHFSIMLVFLALYTLLERFEFPESQIKTVIWIWFAVATIQFLFDREFLAQFISGEREDAYRRGVVGLCSEASFFGISCFYFLHMASRFKKHKVFYMILITAMSVLYAQSMQGLLFIAVFYIGLLVDSINSRKGIFLVIGIVVGIVVGFLVLRKFAPTSRLVQLFESFFEQGVAGTVENDASATVRLNSILNAIKEALSSYLIPQGFNRRIGSGFGGLLVELGVFGLVETFVIAYCFSLQYKKRYSRILYFLLVYFVMFSNTQMGNPQLLFVMAINLYYHNKERDHEQTPALA